MFKRKTDYKRAKLRCRAGRIDVGFEHSRGGRVHLPSFLGQ
jgi:hypothetical protein